MNFEVGVNRDEQELLHSIHREMRRPGGTHLLQQLETCQAIQTVTFSSGKTAHGLALNGRS